MDGSPPDRLMKPDPAGDGVGGARAGVLEAMERRRRRHELRKLLGRLGEPLRPPPRRAADDRARGVTGENPAAETPGEELPGGLAAVDLAEGLVVVGTGIEVGEHPIGVEGDVHEEGGAASREELGRRLLPLQAAAGMERVAAADPHRQAEELGDE